MRADRALESAPELVPRDRQDPEVRRRLSGPAIRAFFSISATWGISVVQQRALLGWPAPSTYHKYKAGSVGTLPYDMLQRVSLIVGIYKALHILYPQAELADQWVKLRNSNPIFGGKAPIDLMTDGGIDGLYRVRRLLDGRRGGWN